MPSRLRKSLAALFFVTLVSLAAILSTSGTAFATCNNGTHWDTVTQSCV